MALTCRTAVAQRNRKIDAITVRANTGYLRIYDGTQAATPETAIGAQVLLAELRFGNPAFGAAAAALATANAITADPDALATGGATWFRALESDGTTPVFDGSAGVGPTFNLNLNSAAIQIGASVSVTSLTYSEPMEQGT